MQALPVYHSLSQISPLPEPCILLHPLTGNSYHYRRAEAHALLRELIAYRRGSSVDSVQLHHNTGQPARLEGDQPDGPSSCSLSYAGQWVAAAWWPGRAIGLDLTEITLPPDWQAVSQLYFSPTQQRTLEQTAAVTRPERFAHYWAELEARSKHSALGLQEWSVQYESALSPASLYWPQVPNGLVMCLAVA